MTRKKNSNTGGTNTSTTSGGSINNNGYMKQNSNHNKKNNSTDSYTTTGSNMDIVSTRNNNNNNNTNTNINNTNNRNKDVKDNERQQQQEKEDEVNYQHVHEQQEEEKQQVQVPLQVATTPIATTTISTSNTYDTTIRICRLNDTECGYCHGKRYNTIPSIQYRSWNTATTSTTTSAVTASSSTNDTTSSTVNDNNNLQSSTTTQTPSATTTTTRATTTVSSKPILSSLQYSIVVDPTPYITKGDTTTTNNTNTTLILGMDYTTYNNCIEYGWRRCGTHIYKPNNWLSCCPTYTIRLPIYQYTISKSQRKIVKQMFNLLVANVPVVPIIQSQSKQQQQPDHNDRNNNEQKYTITTKSNKSLPNESIKQQQHNLTHILRSRVDTFFRNNESFQQIQQNIVTTCISSYVVHDQSNNHQSSQSQQQQQQFTIPTTTTTTTIPYKIKTITKQQQILKKQDEYEQQQEQQFEYYNVTTTISICSILSFCYKNNTTNYHYKNSNFIPQRTIIGTTIVQQLHSVLQLNTTTHTVNVNQNQPSSSTKTDTIAAATTTTDATSTTAIPSSTTSTTTSTVKSDHTTNPFKLDYDSASPTSVLNSSLQIPAVQTPPIVSCMYDPERSGSPELKRHKSDLEPTTSISSDTTTTTTSIYETVNNNNNVNQQQENVNERQQQEQSQQQEEDSDPILQSAAIIETPPLNSSLIIQNVLFHERSGEIVLQLQIALPLVQNEDQQQQRRPQNDATIPVSVTNTTPATTKASTTTTTSSRIIQADRLGSWWSNYRDYNRTDWTVMQYQQRLQQQQLQLQYQSVVSNNCLPTTTQLQAPYNISIKTIPAHESALIPAVHQLYWYYQNQVHHDPYPLSDIIQHNHRCQNKQLQQEIEVPIASINNNNNSIAFDTTSTNATIDPSSSFLRDDVTTGSNRDWETDFAPIGWKKQAEQMLQMEYMTILMNNETCINNNKNDTNNRNSAMKLFESIRASYISFYEFLVESPLINMTSQQQQQEQQFQNNQNDSRTTSTTNAKHCITEHVSKATTCTTDESTTTTTRLPFGTYHQHYILTDSSGDEINTLLIAVGVIDILPKGISSVYLFYNPDFSKELVPLGKYTALKEIEFTRQQYQIPSSSSQSTTTTTTTKSSLSSSQKHSSNVRHNHTRNFGKDPNEEDVPYYYLGYYIHTCVKMSYKIDYKPSQLLCPTTYRWVNADVAKAIIDRDSPIHGCCTLYNSAGDSHDTTTFKNKNTAASAAHIDGDVCKDSNGTRNAGNNTHVTKQELQTIINNKYNLRKLLYMQQDANRNALCLASNVVNSNIIRIDTGCHRLIRLCDIPKSDYGQLESILKEYALYAGSDLAKDCIIKLA